MSIYYKLYLASVIAGIVGMLLTRNAEWWATALWIFNFFMLLLGVYQAGKSAAAKEIELASKMIDYSKGGDAGQ